MKSQHVLIGVAILALGLAVGSLLTIGGIAYFRSTNPQLPPTPAKVTFRKAITGPGYVVRVQNSDRLTHRFSVRLMSSSGNSGKSYALAIDGGKASEIGHLEGWTAISGDTIEVASDGFQTSAFQIP